MLKVDHLSVQFHTKRGKLSVLDDISFQVRPSEILSIVGESGCGKSTAALAIMRLLAANAEISQGKALIHGQDLFSLNEADMCKLRGNKIAMIFQDPMTSLNPTQRIGKQLSESYRIHQKMNKAEAREASRKMLEAVGIPYPEKRLDEYPHQLSGGMRQRVMISMALACNPELLIADEPTTALDVTIQAQILDLMRKMREEKGTAILLITHDLGVVAEMSDRVLVLYAGQTVECGLTRDLFERPLHPYTKGLLNSLPRLDRNMDYLPTIEGVVPSPGQMPKGCRYCSRCPQAMPICTTDVPPETRVGESRVACFLYQDRLEQNNAK